MHVESRTKYSVEEAKKLMIEGTVEVVGTVKIDNSDKVENYYILAEKSYETDHFNEAENYCNKILEINPEYYKAWILKGYIIASNNPSLDDLATADEYFYNAWKYAPEDIKTVVEYESDAWLFEHELSILESSIKEFENKRDLDTLDFIEGVLRSINDSKDDRRRAQVVKKIFQLCDSFDRINKHFNDWRYLNPARTLSEDEFDTLAYRVIKLIKKFIYRNKEEVQVKMYDYILKLRQFRYNEYSRKMWEHFAKGEKREIDEIQNKLQKIKLRMHWEKNPNKLQRYNEIMPQISELEIKINTLQKEKNGLGLFA